MLDSLLQTREHQLKPNGRLGQMLNQTSARMLMKAGLIVKKSGIFVRRHYTNQTGASVSFHFLSSPENIRAIILWGGISHVKLAYR